MFTRSCQGPWAALLGVPFRCPWAHLFTPRCFKRSCFACLSAHSAWTVSSRGQVWVLLLQQARGLAHSRNSTVTCRWTNEMNNLEEASWKPDQFLNLAGSSLSLGKMENSWLCFCLEGKKSQMCPQGWRHAPSLPLCELLRASACVSQHSPPLRAALCWALFSDWSFLCPKAEFPQWPGLPAWL